MSDKAILMCWRAVNPSRVQGSTVSNCSECDAQVWVAPSSHAILMEHNPRIICDKCAIVELKAMTKEERDAIKFIHINKEQIKEIKKYVETRNGPSD